MAPATAGILSTGSEILEGLYADTNAQWLSARLTEMGMRVLRHMAAPDRADDVADAIEFLAARCDVVVMTGGLGPTEDDLTRQAVCRAFGRDLQHDDKAWRMIERRYAHRGTAPPASNRVQCLVPQGARVLYNRWGTAPGFAIEDGPGPWFAALPGPPREMRPMFDTYLRDDLAARFGGGLRTRIATMHTFGISESALNETMRDLFDELRGHPTEAIAFLAGKARVDVRLVVRAASDDALRRRTDALVRRVRRRAPGECIYGRDDETLEGVVGKLLRRHGLTLALAESCTGGLVAKRLTDLPGSSKFLLESCVTYSNEAKVKRLGVRRASLERHGAVSEQTAREMARGALKRSRADIAVAVTGIAGPGGGSRHKPVGTVWYAIAWRPARLGDAAAQAGEVRCEAVRTGFRSGRELVRLYASHRALDLVRRCLLGLPLEVPSYTVAAPRKGDKAKSN